MIPATHFLPLHDGTAWVVFGDDDNERDFFPAEWVTDLDRPCDTCDGGTFEIDKGFNGGVCPECAGTGRHTIGAEVVEHEPYGDSVRRHSVTYRASVIPGMILPIRDNETDYDPPNHSGDMFICADGTAYIDTPEDYMTDITLPSAAAPGMWAVKLRLCS